MTLFLTEQEVGDLLSMADALRVVEDAFRDLGNGRAVNRPRQRVRSEKMTLNVMPAGLVAAGYAGFKYYTSAAKTRFWFHLLDATTGDVLAVMQADRLGQQRTGAASGVATRYLARADASSVGLVGTGWQAESQLEAICATRAIRDIQCFSRDPEHRQSFARTMSARLNVDVRGVDSAEQAVREADIVVTATSANEPLVRREWLAPGAHVNAIGSNRLTARELDDEIPSRCAFVCVDSVEQAKIEATDLISPVERGSFTWDRVCELGEVVAGKVTGRAGRDDITLFKSLGIAAEDVAAGAWVYRQALARGIGREIEL
ncbi:MAG: ornithine cyclodeaminase family protein [Chloroflexi bacterium]|nr:ornithine cyclodeaminase family protein [Chloroflexota bacterium]